MPRAVFGTVSGSWRGSFVSVLFGGRTWARVAALSFPVPWYFVNAGTSSLQDCGNFPWGRVRRDRSVCRSCELCVRVQGWHSCGFVDGKLREDVIGTLRQTFYATLRALPDHREAKCRSLARSAAVRCVSYPLPENFLGSQDWFVLEAFTFGFLCVTSLCDCLRRGEEGGGALPDAGLQL